jgi:Rnl2 family RNA ligase
MSTWNTRPIPKYPEIALLPRRPEILTVKEVIATEKLHGSNFRIHFPGGMTSIADIRYGSRETEHGTPGEKFPLMRAVEWFQSKPDLLTRMWEVIQSYGFSDTTVFGEAYGPGVKTKGIQYSTGQETLFRAFDIMVVDNFVTYDLFVELTGKMDLPRVPELWRGEPSEKAFDALLEKPSFTAGLHGIYNADIAEGVVLRSNPLLRNVFGEWLIVKHKSQKFSEVSHAPASPKERAANPAEGFVATYVTEGRIRNAIGRLNDRGVLLKNDMTDIPALITEVTADLHKECGPELAELNVPDKQLTSAVSKTLAPIYRKLLV